MRFLPIAAAGLLFYSPGFALAGGSAELRTGVAGHAFDHLGSISNQAETAAASGASIIYVTGFGAMGYQGLPKPELIAQQQKVIRAYLKNARKRGIQLAIGYVCATSIMNLDLFDRDWPRELRTRLHSPVASWQQQGRDGAPLPSWYGGQYHPACMNNPDWREYEHYIVRAQLKAGCDGIFFDNPTVQPQGCYCPWCMKRFAQYLKNQGQLSSAELSLFSESTPSASLRELADKHPGEFLKFRGTIARDFLADMRAYARRVKGGALVTANNSLNSPEAFYSQCRSYAYNIHEMSQAEDFVVVEDMANQPRMLAGGQTVEYTPVYRQLHAIAHGKPLVAVTVAEADYHTPPNLVRLAMAEAAANDASYLSWPTWPEPQRARMVSMIRPEMDLLRRNARLLQDARPRHDVLLFLAFRQWLVTNQCAASSLAVELTRANIPFEVICEDDLQPKVLAERLRGAKFLLAESSEVFTAAEVKILGKAMAGNSRIFTADKQDWLASLELALGRPSVSVNGPSSVRALVQDQRNKTIIHLLNLNVQRMNSFEDKVSEAADILVSLEVPLKKVHSVRALTADASGTSGALKFTAIAEGRESRIEIKVPRLCISSMLVIE